MDAQIEFASDSAIIVRFAPEAGSHRYVRELFERLEVENLPILNLHPAYQSLSVDFDPTQTDPHGLMRAIESAITSLVAAHAHGAEEPQAGRLVEIPVSYGGEEYGPDLGFLSETLKLSEKEIVKLHSEAEYEVAFLGFAPGFAYLLGLDPRLRSPRRPAPRLKVPAGSVGIAGLQTGVYPEESPAGWQIVGRTHVSLFDPKRVNPSLLEIGDHIRFVESEAWSEVGSEGTNIIPFVSREERVGEDGFEIISGGLFSTVQDLGRPGYSHLGVSSGGAADPVSLRLANRLVGNSESAACIEMTAVGGSFRFLKKAWIAVTGSDCSPRLGGHPISMWTSYPVRPGQVLALNTIEGGLRSYLAVSGGVAVPELMGSRSTFVGGLWGGHEGRELRSGDTLGIVPAERPRGYLRARSTIRRRFAKTDGLQIRVTRGPQWDWFSEEAKHNIFECEFKVTSEANRRGLRLEGPSLSWSSRFESEELVTEGVAAGSIQVPAGGQALVLYCEQQTTGGYPKIVTIARADLFLLGQLRPGDTIRFKEVTLEEAWGLARAEEEELKNAILPI